MKHRAALAMVAALALLAPACGGDDETTTTEPATGGATTVDVTLQEFAVGTSVSSAAAGDVTFNATNDGPDDEHEFVVIKTDLAIDALPTVDDGSVDEEGEGMEVIGEIEGIAVDASDSTTLALDAGAYALICNIVQEEPDGTIEAHYAEGMRTAFTVM